jgi:hypothetical protein
MDEVPPVPKKCTRTVHKPQILDVDAGSKRRAARITITVPEKLAVAIMQQMLGRSHTVKQLMLVWDQAD